MVDIPLQNTRPECFTKNVPIVLEREFVSTIGLSLIDSSLKDKRGNAARNIPMVPKFQEM